MIILLNKLIFMLEFIKYRDKFRKIYPNCSDYEIEKIFHLREDFWKIIIDNYEWFGKGEEYKKNWIEYKRKTC